MSLQITDVRELLARRLIAQGLAPSAARPAWDTPLAVVQSLLALQGQTYAEGVRSIAIRVAGAHEDIPIAETDITATLATIESGHIVRAWPQRGTLHFLATEDARWMGRLLFPRVATAARNRRPGLGITEDLYHACHTALLDKLTEHSAANPLPRSEVYKIFEHCGLDPSGGRGSHLLRSFGGQGDIVQGIKPATKLNSPAAETFIHVDTLPVEQRNLTGDAAYAELAARYINAHGPVCVADLMWWTALNKSLANKALDLAVERGGMDGASGKIFTTTFDGETYWLPAWQADATSAELASALEMRRELPAFDEYLLGYSNKAQIVPDHVRVDVLTSNGLSWPWVVAGGVGVGSLRKK